MLVAPHLEACGAPINKLDRPLGLDGCDGGVDVLGYHVATVQHAAGHVLPMARITFHHLQPTHAHTYISTLC